MGPHDERSVPMAFLIPLVAGVASAFVGDGWGWLLAFASGGVYWFVAGFLYSRDNRVAHILVDVFNNAVLGIFVLILLTGAGVLLLRVIQKIGGWFGVGE